MADTSVQGNGLVISDGHAVSLLRRIKEFTPLVLFMTFYLSITAWNYGYDNAVFSGVQAMPAFIARFGTCNVAGKCVIKPYLSSIMNSFPFLGKLVGCWVAAPVAERFGRKIAVLLIALISFIGVILQISATTAAQFTIGRMFCFGMTGISVIVMPAFMAECAPAILRGMVTSQLQCQIVVAQLVAASVNYRTSKIASNAGWRISIGIQFAMPGMLLLFYPCLANMICGLLSRDRSEEATNALRKLRKKNIAEELIKEEISVLSHSEGNESKGSWREVFDSWNRRRTIISLVAMIGQQITGQAFATQYAVVFYKQQGFKISFALGLIMQALGVVAVLFTSSIVDSFGRRRLLIGGGLFQAIFLFIMGAVGTIRKPSQAERNLMVASFMLFFFFYLLAWAPLPYVVLGEASSRRVVEKTANLAVSLSVLTAFLVSFTVPYLIGAQYANLGAKVGFIYGSLSIAVVGMTFWLIPEMRGRSLEELDELFHAKTPTRKFRYAKVTAASRIREKEVSELETAEFKTKE